MIKNARNVQVLIDGVVLPHRDVVYNEERSLVDDYVIPHSVTGTTSFQVAFETSLSKGFMDELAKLMPSPASKPVVTVGLHEPHALTKQQADAFVTCVRDRFVERYGEQAASCLDWRIDPQLYHDDTEAGLARSARQV